ncbi:unnamed protein product [Ranitomeya imitator]|uniref:Uncharacterized protein n=1 Tax=Ranitomeya imitator TaxID=111125 RepID=A0ABN9L772_9NEOB|nr:unnamed protein product [Ranitomeya imitator]
MEQKKKGKTHMFSVHFRQNHAGRQSPDVPMHSTAPQAKLKAGLSVETYKLQPRDITKGLGTWSIEASSSAGMGPGEDEVLEGEELSDEEGLATGPPKKKLYMKPK